MKKKYIICFFVAAAILGLAFGYYQGYAGLKLDADEEKYIEGEDAQVMAAEDTTQKSTQMILETYNEVKKTLDKEVCVLPAAYLGMTRTQLVETFDRYMEDMPLEEMEKGLIGYDLMYFSKDYVMIRKTYHPQEDFHKYYIKFSRGCITVFYSDKETVYEYTDILLDDLPVKLQSEVISGKKVKDEKALYDFLENYSS